MARYKKNAKGLYRKTFTIDGKKYCVYSKTIDGLFDKESQKRNEVLNKIEKEIQDVHNPTLNDYYVELYKIRKNQIRESTLRGQKQLFQNISNVEMVNGKKFGEYRIKDITRRDIEIARQKLLDQGKTPENINDIFAHLNHVLNLATQDETIDKNPCKNLKQIKRSKEVATKTIHRALSIDETINFFSRAKARNSYYYNLFELMIKTGMRIGEATALYETDIDRKKGFIHVRKTITRDEAGAYIVSEFTKTDSGTRDIPLSDDVYNIIKKQIELNRSIFGFRWSGLIFQSVEGKILREYTVNREIKRICKDIEIEKFTSHAFRDTFATRFIEQRPQDYKILSEILGHKDVSITLNLYTHVMTENKVIAMNNVMIKIG